MISLKKFEARLWVVWGPVLIYRWNSKKTVEDGLTLDLSKLVRDGSIRPGLAWQGTLIWSNTRTGEKVASIGYEANLIKPDNAISRLLQ